MISIIVPVYNTEKYLQRCIDSILEQSYIDFEVLLINDGSTDKSIEILKEISDEEHVLIMLADPDISVKRFFERPDREKQFLYKLLQEEENPNLAMENFRNCLKRINNEENYNMFLNSGFKVILRDESRTVDETLKIVSKHFKLGE